MRDGHYDYLSKSSVGSPLAFKKSPNKYTLAQSKVGEYNAGLSASTTSGKNDWGRNQYRDIKKVSDQISNLRQTFDSRTNMKLQQRLAKYDTQTQQNYQPSNKLDDLLRQTFHTKVSSPVSRDLTSSTAYDRAYQKDDFSDYLKNSRSPISEKRSKKEDIDEKFKKYVNTVQKVKDFKEQLEATNKMNEQLKKLKQDRRKRLQAKQKQLNEIQKRLNDKEKNTQTFRKKDYYYEYYTPKEQKSTYQDRFNAEKLSKTTLDLSKYKSSTLDQPLSTLLPPKKKYGQSINEPKTPTIRRKLSDAYIGKGKMQVYDFNMGKNLGQGKFGVVYQAVHKPTGWLFAIKKVPKDMIKSHLMIDQFVLELKLQTFLNHENILSLFHHFEDKTSIYLVLQYMQQGTLFTHLKKNKTLGQKEVATKVKQIASAVKYLHENAIAHRDIKPENIVMSHGICKLCDFGWSTVCDQRRKTYCGTFDYAPPQILQGVQYDYTVDLWCLGVLTYQLLVGKAPFYHISRKQTMKKILNVQKMNIEYPENLSKNAVSFIESLIKKDPKQRLNSDVILEHPFLKYAEDKN